MTTGLEAPRDVLELSGLTRRFGTLTALVGLDAVAWWQFGISVLITVASTAAVARAAAGIYRRAILRTGRRVRVREVLRGRALP